MELPRPPVVAEAGPECQHLVDGRSRKLVDAREAVQEALVIGQHGFHPGLLQHDLGHPDAIRILRAAPGQIAPVAVEPGEQIAPEGGLGRYHRDKLYTVQAKLAGADRGDPAGTRNRRVSPFLHG